MSHVKAKKKLYFFLASALLLFPLISRADTMSSQNWSIEAGTIGTGAISSSSAGSQNYSVESLNGSSATQSSSSSSSSIDSDNDTISLNISAVKYQAVSPTEIDITWQTNNSSDAEIRYGTDQNLADRKTDHIKSNNHTMRLGNLTPGTEYYFRIYSHDNNSQSEHTKIYSLTLPKVGETVVSNETTGVGANPESGGNGQFASVLKQSKINSQNNPKINTNPVGYSSGWWKWIAGIIILVLIGGVVWATLKLRKNYTQTSK
ncbi:MAG: fibronectin type III domain-containing protein [Candidatus Pacebacteria bacterium]|nr:fibronectin type III domain-containing protein [Candidatus Paceibacterota bacterium]